MNPHSLVWLVVLPLIGWRLYARFRRLVGRQRMSSGRTWFRIILFSFLVLALALASLVQMTHVAALMAGVAAGAALGVYGLGKTQFEATPAGLYYTPNAHLGIALSLLFVGRIIYRFMVAQSLDPDAMSFSGGYRSNAVTLAIFGLLAGYYVSYAIGLIRWHGQVAHTVVPAGAPVAAPPPGRGDSL